ncbi:hypothetical protein [Streptomyces sp. NBC_00258]|uniref:hypothetical protein n=1 Tax=Streptomyces sp. NBC_00258 TaxID=2903642 RepID=UPI002E2D982D|nr:hypothetical protein [Streptomyces sp. NBC_00258]
MRLKTTLSNQREEIAELRQLVTQLTLANAVLTHQNATSAEPPGAPDADNVVPIRPPS